jgi:hypothetical protein
MSCYIGVYFWQATFEMLIDPMPQDKRDIVGLMLCDVENIMWLSSLLALVQPGSGGCYEPTLPSLYDTDSPTVP